MMGGMTMPGMMPDGMMGGMMGGPCGGLGGPCGGMGGPCGGMGGPCGGGASFPLELAMPTFGGGGGGCGGGASMQDIMKDPSKHCSGATISDQEVKVQDPSGRPMTQYARYATFDEAPFPPVIMNALKKAGFPAPSQIQQYCWPLAMQGRDVIGVAATGSGKTISFLLPAFAMMIEQRMSPGAPALLVMAPTRELAVQIQEEADKFGKPDIATICCYGGAPKGPQADAMRRGVHGIIGTPGRLNDFLEGNQMDLSRISKLVLDEADRMLDMGFEPQIRKILAKMPRQRHTMFYSATWPASVRRLASEFLNGAYTVTIGNRDELKGNQDITQLLQTCRSNDKNGQVMQILRQAGIADRNNTSAKGLVFCSTKRMCDQLAQQIDRQGVPCAAIHGDKNQREREAALNGLKEGKVKILVATDVAARGLDVKGVTLVINYDPPSNVEDYVHRIGRTGRAGQKGYAVALVSERDTHALRGIIQVMKRTNQNITPEIEELARNAPPPPPSGRASRGGPPPVQIDPNFRPGLSTGSLGVPGSEPQASMGAGMSAPLPMDPGMGGGNMGGGSSFGGDGGGSSFGVGGGGGGGGSFGGGGGGGGGGGNQEMCGDFRRGNCSRGDRCRFSHGDGGGGGRPPPSFGGGGGGAFGGAHSFGGGGGGRSDAPPGGGSRVGGRRSPSRRRRSPSRKRRSPSRNRNRSRSRDRGRGRDRRRSPSI